MSRDQCHCCDLNDTFRCRYKQKVANPQVRSKHPPSAFMFKSLQLLTLRKDVLGTCHGLAKSQCRTHTLALLLLTVCTCAQFRTFATRGAQSASTTSCFASLVCFGLVQLLPNVSRCRFDGQRDEHGRARLRRSHRDWRLRLRRARSSRMQMFVCSSLLAFLFHHLHCVKQIRAT